MLTRTKIHWAGWMGVILAVAGCGGEAPTEVPFVPEDVEAVIFSAEYRGQLTLGQIHNVIVRGVGRRLVDRWSPGLTPADRLSLFREVFGDYIRRNVNPSYSQAELDRLIDDQIRRMGPQGKFWHLRDSGRDAGSLLTTGEPSWEAQQLIDQLEANTDDPYATVAAKIQTNAGIVSEAYATLAAGEADGIMAMASIADSSLIYWEAEANAYEGGGGNQSYSEYWEEEWETSPPAGAGAALGIWDKIRKIGKAGWADLIGGATVLLTGWETGVGILVTPELLGAAGIVAAGTSLVYVL